MQKHGVVLAGLQDMYDYQEPHIGTVAVRSDWKQAALTSSDIKHTSLACCQS